MFPRPCRGIDSLARPGDLLEHARIPIDNNGTGTERGLRAAALGRKNHYGSRSERGTEVAALFYSLIESAKRYGHEPDARAPGT